MRTAAALLSAAVFWCGCAGRSVVAVKPGYDFARLGRVALLDFRDYAGQSGSGQLVSQALEPYLLRVGYNLVERSQVQKLLQEQAFSQTPAVSPETAEAMGRILGVDAVVMGSVTGFVPERSDTYLQTVQNVSYDPVYQTVQRKDRRGAVMTQQELSHYDVVTTNEQIPATYETPAAIGFSARLVDATTGELLWTGSASEQGSSLATAADQAAKRLMDALKKAWPRRGP